MDGTLLKADGARCEEARALGWNEWGFWREGVARIIVLWEHG